MFHQRLLDMDITRDELLHLASLSALQLSDEEMTHLQKDLATIVAYVGQLQEIDTDDVTPLLQPLGDITSPLYMHTNAYSQPEALLASTHHPIIHNHICITQSAEVQE